MHNKISKESQLSNIIDKRLYVIVYDINKLLCYIVIGHIDFKCVNFLIIYA